ncbi:MAG: radical SAM family heme chaperone HemW [Acidobacteriota bacterium]
MGAPENPEVSIKPAKAPSAIYIHVPFCRRECYYCNFTKFRYDKWAAGEYTKYLCRELKLRGDTGPLIKTVYFGGGSPAVVPEIFLEEIVSTIRENFNLEEVSEMTIEINPEECSPEKLNFLKGLGFNRVSVGVQSFSDKDLQYLGRNHDARRAREALDEALNTGFESVNADLIIGLPGQTEEVLKENVMILSGSGADHISAYILEGVKNFGGRELPDPDQQSYLYNHFRKEAGSSGFDQYEVSNFCRGRKFSMHNMNYWEGGSYIGAGLSAAGFENGEDYMNYTAPENYYGSIKNGKIPVEIRTRHDILERSLAIGLRLVRGIKKEKLSHLKPRILELMDEGFLEETEKYYRVVPSRLVVLNEILSYLI